jgi:hypothetical protein
MDVRPPDDLDRLTRSSAGKRAPTAFEKGVPDLVGRRVTDVVVRAHVGERMLALDQIEGERKALLGRQFFAFPHDGRSFYVSARRRGGGRRRLRRGGERSLRRRPAEPDARDDHGC